MVKQTSVLDGGDDAPLDAGLTGTVTPVRGPKVRFVVEPQLCVQGKPLPLESLSQQTVLTRCLGPLANWDAALAETIAAGYNSVHFTPVQALGESGSAYSIYDQLRLSADIFRGQPDVEDAVKADTPQEDVERLKIALLRAKVEELESRCVGFSCDCVCACACVRRVNECTCEYMRACVLHLCVVSYGRI